MCVKYGWISADQHLEVNMSNNKQSSVEWLYEKMFMHRGLITIEEFEQAKAMHKEEITQAFDEGQEYEYQYHINSTPKFDSETYYIETYGG